MIFSAYRKGDYADPEAFSEQLFLVLKQYSESVITAISDPRRSASVQMSYKHPPTIREVAELCEQESAKQFKAAEDAGKYRTASRNRNRDYVPPPNFPGCRAVVFVHADAPQYPALEEWSRFPDTDARDWRLDQNGRPGIWVAYSIFENIGAIRKRSSQWKTPSDGDLRASLARLAGLKPALEIDAP